METKNDRTSSGVRDALNDSWFDKAEIRAVAAELRARLSRAYRAEDARAEDGTLLAGAVAQPGLDDSWFK